jgi:hypothetical protein
MISRRKIVTAGLLAAIPATTVASTVNETDIDQCNELFRRMWMEKYDEEPPKIGEKIKFKRWYDENARGGIVVGYRLDFKITVKMNITINELITLITYYLPCMAIIRSGNDFNLR